MRACRACGGILGRDCFNEEDCLMIMHSQQSGNNQAAEELASLCDIIGVEAREVDPLAAGELWQKNDIRGLIRLMHDRAITAQEKVSALTKEKESALKRVGVLETALREWLSNRDFVIAAGGKEGPLSQDVIRQFAKMQQRAVDMSEAALKGESHG